MSNEAVNCLVIEPISNTVSAVFEKPRIRSAKPAPLFKSSISPCATITAPANPKGTIDAR
jgi:hypothetical protein